MPGTAELWAMERRDVDWVTETSRRRRAGLVPHAPTFWRPASDAAERHRAFLAALIEDPSVLSVRTSHAFLFAVERSGAWLVDDMAVERADLWPSEGAHLLRHALECCGRVRFVVPVFETDRMEAATAVGLVPVENWWHRDLNPVSTPASGDPGISVPGASGRLVPAPPVYDPRGPVLLVTELDAPAALERIEDVAASRGARVAVVSHSPADSEMGTFLQRAGYALTTAFCESGHSSGSSLNL